MQSNTCTVLDLAMNALGDTEVILSSLVYLLFCGLLVRIPMFLQWIGA